MTAASLLQDLKKLLDGLLRGFGVGLGMELVIRVLVMAGFLPETFRGFVFVVVWCIYANHFYYQIAGDRISHNLLAAVVMGLLFGGVAGLVLLLQGLALLSVPLYTFVFSLLLSWTARFSVRRARRRMV